MTLLCEWHHSMKDTIVWMTPQYEWYYSMSELTLEYECHYGMNDITIWMTLQYERPYSTNDTTVWMTLHYEWHYSMKDTTVWTALQYERHYSVYHFCQHMQLSAGNHVIVSCFPGNSIRFPWQPRYRHRAKWQQADSREEVKIWWRNSDVTWPHGG